jgi:acyl-CoA dehydrogenase
MPINLETPRKFAGLISQAHMVATEVFRPNSRKYDDAEHSYPKELDMLAAAIDGMNESGALGGAGAGGVGGNGNGNGSSNGASAKKADPNANRAVLGRRRPAADDAATGPRAGRDRRCRRR